MNRVEKMDGGEGSEGIWEGIIGRRENGSEEGLQKRAGSGGRRGRRRRTRMMIWSGLEDS